MSRKTTIVGIDDIALAPCEWMLSIFYALWAVVKASG